MYPMFMVKTNRLPTKIHVCLGLRQQNWYFSNGTCTDQGRKYKSSVRISMKSVTKREITKIKSMLRG